MLERSQSQDQKSDSAVRSLQSLVTTPWNEADLCKAPLVWTTPASSLTVNSGSVLLPPVRLLRAMAWFQVLFSWILGLQDLRALGEYLFGSSLHSEVCDWVSFYNLHQTRILTGMEFPIKHGLQFSGALCSNSRKGKFEAR